jgi:indolepyruvate ferredoxin oxidoreductase beta subunit
MKNILITGVGGQGTVLAAKILAQAAQAKGWSVREAETIGMAQRGGFVTSHVRMGDAGEEVYSPLLAKCSADLVIAFEPAEAARALPYLAPGGLLVTASSPIQPVAADPYDPADVLAEADEEALADAVDEDAAPEPPHAHRPRANDAASAQAANPFQAFIVPSPIHEAAGHVPSGQAL